MEDQERLEKAKQEYKEWVEMHDGIVPSEDLKEFEEDANQRWWLIQQAEEKQELEERLETLSEQHDIALEQNKRYEEAIKQGINATRYTNPEVAHILSEVLESDKQ